MEWKVLVMSNKDISEIGASYVNPLLKREKDMFTCKSPFFSLSQIAERFAAHLNLFARLYSYLFYKKMLCREVALAGLEPGSSVLHIGGGAYPYTAVFLARKGYRVNACDCNIMAINIAKGIVQRSGYADKITITHENGCFVDCSGYDAIWVSLNICPKKRIIEHSWVSLKKGGILVYRKLPGWFRYFGINDINITEFENGFIEKSKSGIGAESLVIIKG
jgi:hypothetical protein